MTTKYRLTHIDFDALEVKDLGTIDSDDLRAMERLPGWNMVRHADGTVWLSVDGRGWEQLHVCTGGNHETQD